MNSSYLFGGRLKEERKRLKLSQAEAATRVGVSREMWGKYERGAKPGADVLSAMERSGFNISYILAGSNTLSVNITLQELEMIDKFRLTSDAVQKAVFTLLNIGQVSTKDESNKHE